VQVMLVQVTRPACILALCLTASLPLAQADTTQSSSVNNRAATPRVVTPFTSFNFGDVYAGEVVSQIFVIKNEGDGELQIKDFLAGCACSVARSDRVIAPGKAGTATIEVETASQTGSIYKTATLYTNDPTRPTIDFAIIANVLRGSSVRRGKHIGPIFLSPDSRVGLYASSGKKAVTEFSVTANNAPVKVLAVEGGAKLFTSRVEEIDPGRSYKIVVESLPVEAGGLYTDHLRVLTDNSNLPAFTIEVFLRVYPKE
jgi:uncharacterized protein DUF1573